ncbi:MAG: transcriptional regulatory protein [uncultured bacterium]|nr:MAG: transcriptional regulatory protein [uncultured bacterium]
MADEKKILVVDDEQSVREVLEVCLTGENFDVSQAENGEQALKVCKEKRPDLIILDVKLPDLLGMEVAQIINESPQTYGSPKIIIITGTIDTSHRSPVESENMRLKAKAQWQKLYGVSDFLSKPFDFEQILKLVKSSLGQE